MALTHEQITPDMIDKILSEQYDYVPFSYRNNDVINRRRINLLAIFAIIVITILFIRDLIKYFKNN